MSFSRQNVLEQLQVGLRRVVRAAAAEVRLGDERRRSAGRTGGAGRPVPCGTGPGRTAGRACDTSRHSAIGKLMKRTRGSRSWSVSLPVTASGQALLAVEAEARGEDHRGCGRGPAPPRAPSGSPRSRTRPTAPAPAARRPATFASSLDQPPARLDFDRRDGVVGGHRQRRRRSPSAAGWPTPAASSGQPMYSLKRRIHRCGLWPRLATSTPEVKS